VVTAVAKLLVPISALLLGFLLIITVVSIDHGWTAEFGDVGDPTDVSDEWITRGTLFSPPLAPIIVQAVLTALALVRRRVWQLVAGAGLALLGALYRRQPRGAARPGGVGSERRRLLAAADHGAGRSGRPRRRRSRHRARCSTQCVGALAAV